MPGILHRHSLFAALLGALACAGCQLTGSAPARPAMPGPPSAEDVATVDGGPGPDPQETPTAAGVATGPPVALATPAVPPAPAVWGVVELRGFASGDKIAPNGIEFRPIFSTDLNLNVWLWRSQGLYLFADMLFWAQKSAPGITNAGQGAFDFSKREFDLQAGPAWNFYGRWEARAFAYSFNNLNRGASFVSPFGFNDGVGLEARRYLNSVYDSLGTAQFDVARAAFVSAGYYPTKDMVDGAGVNFKPGPFVRAYLTWDLWGDRCYLFGDATLIGLRSFEPKLLNLDTGVAFRPFAVPERWEFRLGVQATCDLRLGESEDRYYGAVRLIY